VDILARSSFLLLLPLIFFNFQNRTLETLVHSKLDRSEGQAWFKSGEKPLGRDWGEELILRLFTLRSYRMVWIGLDLKDHLDPSHCHGQVCHPAAQAAQVPI